MFLVGINAMTMVAGSGFGDIGDSLVEFACKLVEKGCTACSVLIDKLAAFNIMSEVSTNATISSAASTIAILLLTIELCSQAMGFHFDDINEGFRFIFKLVVYKIIIENSSNIVQIVYDLFFKMEGWTELSAHFTNMGTNFNDIGREINDKMTGINEGVLGAGKFFAGLFIGLVGIFVFVMLIKIVISLAGVIFEIGIDIVVAPVPIATLVCHETRSIGINYLKGFAANCMTVVMYNVCFELYNPLAISITNAFSSTALGVDSGFWAGAAVLIPHIISLLLLSVATKNASNMMSKILG